jgi:hypothetical protein
MANQTTPCIVYITIQNMLLSASLYSTTTCSSGLKSSKRKREIEKKIKKIQESQASRRTDGQSNQLTHQTMK